MSLDIISYGYDVWYHIFHNCSSFQLRVLRRVCKTFYDWLNDETSHKLYYNLMHKEHHIIEASMYDPVEYEKYFKVRRITEKYQLDNFPPNEKEYVIFNCNSDGYTVELNKNEPIDEQNGIGIFLHFKGLLLKGRNADLTVELEIGGNRIDIMDHSLLTYDISLFGEVIENAFTIEERKDLLYYPLYQAGSLRVPAYHHAKIHLTNETSKTKVYMIGEYRICGNKTSNLLNNGNIHVHENGMNWVRFV